ncbi:heat shock protein HtpX [Halopenitus malekzadehii]|uniref:Heat shock protein HtpX n=1 Tax=Halopenitus malekzadehii TaxID=1267564 RepID=A0A1H6JWR5_9EURY|nr:M48 family metalloprotease [Halopenitus malekzadehii]SEH67036.1 heat shock protein HtpX [Halopenitus malekzadehii]
MQVTTRTQLSFILRTIVALCLVGVAALVVFGIVGAIGAFLGWYGLGYVLGLFGMATGDETRFYVFLERSGVWLLATFVILAIIWSAHRARVAVNEFRSALLADADTDSDVLSDRVRKLAIQANTPTPAVQVLDVDDPVTFTLGSGGDATIVVSCSIIDRLDNNELDAVLAHELAHLKNHDTRIIASALLPLLVVDELSPDRPAGGIGELITYAIGIVLSTYIQFSVALLSRGREGAADIAAARIVGSPATVANALAKLDKEYCTPTMDKRSWAHATSALNILPVENEQVRTGPFQTHPPTETRIERLRSLERNAK